MRFLPLLILITAGFSYANDNSCVKTAVVHWTPPKAIAAGRTPAQTKRANADQLTDFIKEAVEKGARMVVTPELALVGYPEDRDFEDKKEAMPFAEIIPDVGGAIDKTVSPNVAHFAELAEKSRAFLHIGMLEKSGDHLYNTVVVLGPDGKIAAKHRKVNLVDMPPLGNEKTYITPGTTPTVYDASRIGLGKVGVAICADIYHDDVVKGRRVAPAHLMERYRANPDVTTLAISSAWATDSDPEEGPTKGWTAWNFFEEMAKYANNDAYIPSEDRGKKTTNYRQHATRKVSVLVSNTNNHGPGAGIFHGANRVLGERRGKDNHGVVVACVPNGEVRADNATPPNATHVPKR